MEIDCLTLYLLYHHVYLFRFLVFLNFSIYSVEISKKIIAININRIFKKVTGKN